MKKNVGNVDKIVRVMIAALASALYFTETLTGIWGIVALVIGGAMLLTSTLSFCGLYTIFGINTCKLKEGGK